MTQSNGTFHMHRFLSDISAWKEVNMVRSVLVSFLLLWVIVTLVVHSLPYSTVFIPPQSNTFSSEGIRKGTIKGATRTPFFCTQLLGFEYHDLIGGDSVSVSRSLDGYFQLNFILTYERLRRDGQIGSSPIRPILTQVDVKFRRR
jgi:hypothetical protein